MTNDRIQVVDDEHDFVTFLVKCLQRMEYVVADISTTGETAVAAAQRSKPDLVLMDICLLGAMDGIEAAARIRSQLNIPVVFLTGTDDEKTIQRAKISEPLGYLLKPFKPRELKTTIDSALYTFRASRERAKEADRVATERYRSLFENAVEGIFQAKLSGTVLAANAAAARMLGYESAEEILNSGVTLQTLLHISPEEEIELTKRLNEQNTVEGYELEVVRKVGRKIVLSMNLRAVRDDLDAIAYVEGSAVDITARKQAEEKLIHEKQLMCTLMDNLPDSIYFKDNQSRFVRINRAMAAKIGLNDPELIVGKTDFDIFTEEHARAAYEEHARAAYEDERAILRTGCPLVNHEEEETWPDRPSTWVSTTKMPLRDEAGNVIGTFGISRDITKRKRAEKERARMEVQLRQAQKLESVGQLAAGIAHEISTPMQYVGDKTRFLQEAFQGLQRALTAYERFFAASKAGTVDPKQIAELETSIPGADLPCLLEEIPKAISQTLEAVERVSTIVKAMKEFSHTGPAEKTAVDLRRAIETTLIVCRNEWKYVSDVTTEFDDTMPQIQCLPGELNQIILNLVTNAAQAIAPVVESSGGRKGKIIIRTRRDGNWAEIQVADTGVGIPEDVRTRIFDPFFTTAAVGKRSGQGLAIVHNAVVTRHGGTIGFETEVGKGTTFTVRLPIS